MTTTPLLLARIDRFLERTGMTDEQFSRKACNNTRLLMRIRAGGDFKLARAAQIEEYLRRNPLPRKRKQK